MRWVKHIKRLCQPWMSKTHPAQWLPGKTETTALLRCQDFCKAANRCPPTLVHAGPWPGQEREDELTEEVKDVTAWECQPPMTDSNNMKSDHTHIGAKKVLTLPLKSQSVKTIHSTNDLESKEHLGRPLSKSKAQLGKPLSKVFDSQAWGSEF